MIYPGRLAPVQDIMNQMPNVEGATSTDKLSSYMLEPLLGCGYHLYVDNWGSSLRLFRYYKVKILLLVVLSEGTDCHKKYLN